MTAKRRNCPERSDTSVQSCITNRGRLTQAASLFSRTNRPQRQRDRRMLGALVSAPPDGHTGASDCHPVSHPMRVTPLEPSAPSSPAHSPRRAFVARLAGVIATWPFVGSRLGAIVASRFGSMPVRERAPNASLLDALGDAVLPAELGPPGVTRAVGAFQQWMDQYRPGAEANHGYGTGRIESVPADPRPVPGRTAVLRRMRVRGHSSKARQPRAARVTVHGCQSRRS